MRAVVVGQGSIGVRHVEVLRGLGLDVKRCSRRSEASDLTLEQAMQLDPACYVVVATETNRHIHTLQQLATLGHSGPVLCEKPLAAQSADMPSLDTHERCRVGYNLRFHPLVERVRNWIDDTTVVVSLRAGQDLTQWRLGRGIDSTASAERVGGGLLRDFSHELDYLQWWLGPWSSVVAQQQELADLPGVRSDACAAIINFANGAVANVSLNYLDAPPQRNASITRLGESLTIDLIRSAWTDPLGDKHLVQVDRDDTYRSLHTAMLKGSSDARLCSLAEATDVMTLIEGLEHSISTQSWVVR